MAERYEYCFQTLTNESEYHPGEPVWVDVPMYPPGLGNGPEAFNNYEAWVAYLNYIRIAHPDTKYRLTATITTTSTEILDV